MFDGRNTQFELFKQRLLSPPQLQGEQELPQTWIGKNSLKNTIRGTLHLARLQFEKVDFV